MTTAPNLNTPLRICSRTHLCEVAGCRHKQPHRGKFQGGGCGISMPCHSDPSGEISACIPVKDGSYEIPRRDDCTHCKGKGYHARIERHDVPEEVPPHAPTS